MNPAEEFDPRRDVQPRSEVHPQPDVEERPDVVLADSNDEPAPLEGTAQTPGELAEARAYGHIDLACDLADRLLDLAFLAIFALVFARRIDAWLQESVTGASLRLLALYSITTLLHAAVSFPLSFYRGYVLEHQFGLSRLKLGGWFWRYAKRNVLTLLFGGLLMLGLYWAIWLTGGWWWLVAAFCFFAVSVLIGQLMPVLILPLFYKVKPIDQPELNDRLARLARGTGLTIEGVYRMDMSAETVKANAMLAGLGSTRRVIMGDTLLDGFSADEIEVIFAHEIGHHVYRHLPKLIVGGVVFSAAGFWICDWVLRAWVGQAAGAFDYASLPVATLPLLLLTLTIFGMIFEPLQNAISRHFERQCDRYALRRTGLKAAYLSAFRKLAKLNKDDPHPPSLAVLLFHSHPPISERLALAEE